MKKLLSIILCVFILCATFPLSVLADEIGYDTVSEAVELREENVKHFLNPDGSYTALAYSKPVHRLDENGSWQDLENIMNEETRGNKQAYITSDGRTVFSKKINSTDNEIFTLNEGKYEISVSFVNEGLKNTTAKLSNHAKKYTPSKFDKLETQYKKLKEIDTTTTLLYKNALSGVDLEYVLSVNDIKENIIVRKLQDEYSYSFIYELNGLIPELNDDGSITLKDKEILDTIYSMPAPFMVDNSGEISQEVEYILTDKGNGVYEITVVANAEWINSPERELPVVIDPTFSGGANGLDTYIDAYYPDTNYGNSKSMYVSANQFTYMSHASLYNLVDNATITSVSIALQYSTTATSGSAVIKIHPVTTSWKENTWTWNTASGYTNRGLSYSNTSTATLTASTTTRTVNIDLTSFYHSAYAGMPYYGIGISYVSGSIPTITIPSGEATRTVYTINYEKNAPIASGTYLLASGANTDKVMQLNNNNSNVLEIWEYDGDLDQKWEFKNLKNGYYKITSAENGKSMTADSNDIGSYIEISNYDYSSFTTQWKIIETTSGKYKISPRSNMEDCIKITNTDDARNVYEDTYSNDNNYLDEWVVADYKATLIALDELGVPRNQYFSATKNLLNAKKGGVVSTVKTISYSYMINDIMFESMQLSDIFVVHTHGTQTSIQTNDPNAIVMDINYLRGKDLSNLDFALLLTCDTGVGFNPSNITNNTPVNIVEQMVICGAETVVGFSVTTYVPDCNMLAVDLMEGITVNKRSVRNAFMSIDYAGKGYTMDMSEVCVIGGNEQNILY